MKNPDLIVVFTAINTLIVLFNLGFLAFQWFMSRRKDYRVALYARQIELLERIMVSFDRVKDLIAYRLVDGEIENDDELESELVGLRRDTITGGIILPAKVQKHVASIESLLHDGVKSIESEGDVEVLFFEVVFSHLGFLRRSVRNHFGIDQLDEENRILLGGSDPMTTITVNVNRDGQITGVLGTNHSPEEKAMIKRIFPNLDRYL